jgi:hypothetical protein
MLIAERSPKELGHKQRANCAEMHWTLYRQSTFGNKGHRVAMAAGDKPNSAAGNRKDTSALATDGKTWRLVYTLTNQHDLPERWDDGQHHQKSVSPVDIDHLETR